jgi:hypothetical protein
MNRQAPNELVAGLAFLAGCVLTFLAMTNSNTGIPLCGEDEVLTQRQECVTQDDATYVPGEGWVLGGIKGEEYRP